MRENSLRGYGRRFPDLRQNVRAMMTLARRTNLRRPSGRGRVLVAAVIAIGGAHESSIARAEVGAADERAALAATQPAPLEAQGHVTRANVIPVRLRFYADDDHRAGAGDVRERLAQLCASMNRISEPALGVRFTIESVRSWHRTSARDPLTRALGELEKLDPARDVDWVVGLLAPPTQMSSDMHEAGMARTLGRHFVLRGMGSAAERAAFARRYPTLERMNAADLALTFSRRSQHKEAVIFLHEWAHTLGALHVTDPTRILSPTYTTEASVLAPMDVGLLNAALEDRFQDRVGVAMGARDWPHLRAFLARTPPGAWDPRDRARLEAVLGSGTTGSAGPEPAGNDDPFPFIAAARAALTHHDLGQAEIDAAQAAVRAARTSPPDASAWLAIAQVDLQLGAFTAAEEALDRAATDPAATGLRVQVQRARRFHGLPARWPGISPDQEAAFVVSFSQADAALTSTRPARARTLIEAGLHRFSAAPGWLMLACDLAMRESRNQQAHDQCNAALAGMEDLPRAHFLRGTLLLATGKTALALTSLRRAVDLDPAQPAFWDALGEVHAVLGRDEEFRQLRAERARSPAAPNR
jgi:tetratricopeptide (TPR) repeat protein